MFYWFQFRSCSLVSASLLITFFLSTKCLIAASPLGMPRKPACEHYAHLIDLDQPVVLHGDQNNSTWNFEYVDSSMQCDAELGTEWLTYRQCKENELTLALYTETILPEGNFLPYIRLNMSATMLDPSEAVWFVYSCIHAPDEEDSYCHNKDTQLARYGANILPCRGVRSTNNTNKLPFRADVTCFKMFGLSQYQIDVIVRPQRCRATLFATLPVERKFDPRIQQFFSENRQNTTAPDYNNWSPFLFVETHLADGVWVRFEYPAPLSRVLAINFALYHQSSGDSVQYIRDEIVRLPNTGFKWSDLEAGTYIIYAFVQRAHCQLICSNSEASPQPISSCITCPYTMLNFTIQEDKFSLSWSRTHTLNTVAKLITVSFLVLLLIIAFGLISVVIYLRYLRPRRQARRPAQNVELTAQPKVLILYTDDCYRHSECVLQLATFLVTNASARVYIDQWDLVDPSTHATNWLVNKMATVDYVLIVFSAGSRRVMQGERMYERRPFPDLFNPGLRLVVSVRPSLQTQVFFQKITSIVSRVSAFDVSTPTAQTSVNHLQNGIANGSTARTANAKALLKQFVVLRFNYSNSDEVAEFFPLMGCKSYQVPEDLPRLVAHLHKVEITHDSLLEFAADHQQLSETIRAFEQFRAQNPKYLEERFSTDLPNQIGINQLTGSELANSDLSEQNAARTDQEMNLLLNKYGLESEQLGEEMDDERTDAETNMDVRSSTFDRRVEEAYPLVSDDSSFTDD